MTKMIIASAFLLLVVSCENAVSTSSSADRPPIEGVWKLLTGTLIEKTDTIVTDYLKEKSFVKIIYDGHFSFLGHDLNQGKDSTAFYSSGGGTYSLTNSSCTEQLVYGKARNWEESILSFPTISIKTPW